MAANVESMFYVGETPWHKLGTEIKEAPTSKDAIIMAGLDWKVLSRPIFDEYGRELDGYKVNVRDKDNLNLGIVTDRYQIVQNDEAFSFTDALLGEGVRYETAGSLASGKRVWMLARLEGTQIADEDIDPFLVFTNSHDGKGSINVAITPVRVVCQNTLNLALAKASRNWSCVHKGDIQSKLEEAKRTLESADRYMEALEEEFGELKLKTLSDTQVSNLTDELLKMEFTSLWRKAIKTDSMATFKERLRQQKYEDKLITKKNDILEIYHNKPDLVGTEKSAFRFINAVSDYATHTTDHRNTENYQENLFIKTIGGLAMIDTAHRLALAA